MVRLGFVAFAALLAGCAGRSIDTEETGGTAGAGGASSGGGGGRGGTATGGTGGTVSSGGSGATGGSVSSGGAGGTVSSGGTGGSGATGGSLRGGAGGSVSVGGAIMMGGTGGSAMGGSAGAGAACGLPLDSGPCLALSYAYGFDPARGHCVRFPYGGCEGNDNNFDTLVECEAACGGSSIGHCPELRPDLMTMCDRPMLQCVYHWQDGCLCASKTPYDCSKVDPQCPPILRELPEPCSGDDCTADVRIPPNQLCQCGISAVWECVTYQ